MSLAGTAVLLNRQPPACPFIFGTDLCDFGMSAIRLVLFINQ